MAIPSGSGTEGLKRGTFTVTTTADTKILDGVANHIYTVLSIVITETAGVATSAVGLSSSSVLPTVDDTYDLGSASKQWQNIYTGDLHLKNERGSWTVIEEENYLTLRNNKTDKVYKLVMEEIE